ncbi:MAG: O-antigen ligase family protein, partial [Planctomycetota bacterium]
MRIQPENQLSNDAPFLTFGQSLTGFTRIPLELVIGVVLLTSVSFLNQVDLETDNAKVGLSGQVYLKLGFLGLAALYGFWGFVTDSRVQKIVLSFPVLWIVGIFAFFLAAVPGSVTQAESLASTLSIPCVVLLSITMAVRYGQNLFLESLFIALFAFTGLSWVAFLLVPEIGVFFEPLPNGEFQSRMSGLAHPNTLGQYSGLLVVLSALLYSKNDSLKGIRIFAAVLGLAALVLCLSRTSLLATVVALSVIYRDRIFKPQYTVYYLLAACVVMMASVVLLLSMDVGTYLESKLSLLSKSGDTEELTSGTGRNEIWAYTLKLIGEQPAIGYGQATSKVYLADYSLYTHNMILNVMLSGGVIAGLMAIAMVIGRIKD